MVKNCSTYAGATGDSVWSSSQEDPLEEEMATHSSILGETIPRTEEPARLQSMWLKEPDMTELASKKKKKKTLIFCINLPGQL